MSPSGFSSRPCLSLCYSFLFSRARSSCSVASFVRVVCLDTWNFYSVIFYLPQAFGIFPPPPPTRTPSKNFVRRLFNRFSHRRIRTPKLKSKLRSYLSAKATVTVAGPRYTPPDSDSRSCASHPVNHPQKSIEVPESVNRSVFATYPEDASLLETLEVRRVFNSEDDEDDRSVSGSSSLTVRPSDSFYSCVTGPYSCKQFDGAKTPGDLSVSADSDPAGPLLEPVMAEVVGCEAPQVVSDSVEIEGNDGGESSNTSDSGATRASSRVTDAFPVRHELRGLASILWTDIWNVLRALPSNRRLFYI
jgi:hypothetical protein